MNIIKRTVALIIGLIFAVNTVAFAASENSLLNIDEFYLDENYSMCVKISVENGYKNQVISAFVLAPGVSEISEAFYADQITAPKGGNASYTFAPFEFPANFATGEYKIFVFGERMNSAQATLKYYGVEEMKRALAAIAIADGTDIITVAGEKTDDVTNAEFIDVDLASILALDTAAQKNLCQILDHDDDKFTVVADMPIDTAEDAEAIKTVVKNFKNLYSDALKAAEIYSAKNAQSVKEWFESNQSDLDSRYDFNGEASDSAGAKAVYLNQSKKLADVLSKLKKADELDKGKRERSVYEKVISIRDAFSMAKSGNTWDEETPVNANLYSITNSLRDAIILETAHYMPAEYLKNILDDMALRKLIDIDYAKLDKMSDANKAKFYSSMTGKAYDDMDDFASKAEDELDKLTSDKNSGNGGSGGSGGGGGGFGGGSSGGPGLFAGAAGTNNAPVNAADKYFDDLAGNEWAAEYINALYEKKIINGKGNKSFDPNANVTRSEFVKMLVVALGFAVENHECDFNDLTADMWQYSYIATAKSLGIINGYDNGSFGVNDPISRQDMAVITERALRIYGKAFEGEQVSFVDGEIVAEYAARAVANLAAVGIISGMPDGTFAPYSNVTRAQAATVIYKAIR